MSTEQYQYQLTDDGETWHPLGLPLHSHILSAKEKGKTKFTIYFEDNNGRYWWRFDIATNKCHDIWHPEKQYTFREKV